MTTQLPVMLRRRANLFVVTNPPEELVNDDYTDRHIIPLDSESNNRAATSPTVNHVLNTREKMIFAVVSIVVFFGQMIMDFYFWNQTKSKILLFWGTHQVTLLVISLLIMFKTELTMTLFGPRKTMCMFDYFVEYEKISAVVYHSFQFGQVFYKYFAMGILNAECIYHTITFICVIAFLCRSKKYNI